MSIDKRTIKTGVVYRARYRDEAKKEHAKHFKKKSDAKRWLDEQTTSRVMGQYVDPHAGRVTFKDFFEGWLASQTYEDTTVKAMNLAARGTTFADLPLNRIRKSHVEVWVKTMHVHLQPTTIKTRFNNVRAVFRAAVADRLIQSDPSQGVRLPRAPRRESAMRIPTPDQVGRLLDHAPDDFKAYVALCAFAGLRLGEAAALRVGDVDFLRRALTVKRQVQRGEQGRVEVRAPKYGSVRTVYLPDGLLAMLGAHVAAQAAGADGATYFWVNSEGQPPHQNTIGHRWRKLMSVADLSGFTLHDLRHFYASGLIAQGCDVVTVQRAMGHMKATTTLNTYGHLWPDAEDRTRDAAACLMAQTAERVAATA